MERPASVDEIASDRPAATACKSALQPEQPAVWPATKLRYSGRISEWQVVGGRRLPAIGRPVVDGQLHPLAGRRSVGAVRQHAELFAPQVVQEGPKEEPDLELI